MEKARITFYCDPGLEAALRERSRVTGAPLGELIRRAIRLSFFADDQQVRDSMSRGFGLADPAASSGGQYVVR